MSSAQQQQQQPSNQASGSQHVDARAEYARLVERRQAIERELGSLDTQIRNYEETYLKESPYGNVVTGWSKKEKKKKKQAPVEVADENRIFSASSVWTSLTSQADAASS